MNNKYFLRLKKTFSSDVVINATYEGCNGITKNINKVNNFEYQLTNIMEINSKKFKSIGFALMDGPFFHFYLWAIRKILKYISVLHSVLKKGISDKFKYSWLKKNKALKEEY